MSGLPWGGRKAIGVLFVCCGVGNGCDQKKTENFDSYCEVEELACDQDEMKCSIFGFVECKPKNVDYGCKPNPDGTCSPCYFPNSKARCDGDTCVPVGEAGCYDGFKDCDGAPGCETYVNRDVMNCGDCHKECQPPSQNNQQTYDLFCNTGICSYSCKSDFGDCNKDPNDGCEIDLRNDSSNCGACGAKCQPTQTCADRQCK